jgi:hypothetical protein
MGGYDYIAVRAPLLSHNGEKGVVRKGCLKRVFEKGGSRVSSPSGIFGNSVMCQVSLVVK